MSFSRGSSTTRLLYQIVSLLLEIAVGLVAGACLLRLYMLLFISMIGSFKVFVQIYQFTAGTGGPDRAAETIGFYLYQEAFQYFRAGYASAISVIFFLIIVVVTLAQMRLASRRVFYR